MKQITTADPALYVGTYAKYNNGSIAGQWLTLSDYADRDDFIAAAHAIHADEADPEIMYQDFEGFPHCWYGESSAPPEILWQWLELDEEAREACAAYADNLGGEIDIEDFKQNYCGQWDSGADYAENLAEECGDIPKDFPSWLLIDWAASWDCNLSHNYHTSDAPGGGVYIFRN